MNLLNLREPFMISARLLPALNINRTLVQIDEVDDKWIIDIPNTQSTRDAYEGEAPRSPLGGLQECFAALLDFLCAAADSLEYERETGEKGEHTDLFPKPVLEWALANRDDLAVTRCIIEETPDLLTHC